MMSRTFSTRPFRSEIILIVEAEVFVQQTFRKPPVFNPSHTFRRHRQGLFALCYLVGFSVVPNLNLDFQARCLSLLQSQGRPTLSLLTRCDPSSRNTFLSPRAKKIPPLFCRQMCLLD